MLAVLSPAKKLDFSPTPPSLDKSKPALGKDTHQLLEVVTELSAADLRTLMKLSPALAELNRERFQAMRGGAEPPPKKQAVLAFDGDTYVGLQARQFDAEDLAFAQEHLRILSGFYGLLRPLDVIEPYRLEMGTRLVTVRGKSLYEFWGSKLAGLLDRQAKRVASPYIVNLASKEYFDAVRPSLKTPVIDCTFKEGRGRAGKVIGFSAKRARGMMARFMITERLTTPNDLERFKEAGYTFDAAASTPSEYVFSRPRKAT